MRTNNPDNERIKHRYFAYLREAKRLSEASIDGVAAALHRFEAYTSYREFKAFHYQQAVAFKRHLAEEVSRRSGDRLSKATLCSTLAALRNFFFWLAGQPGFRSRLTYSDAEYFNASEKDGRVAKAHRDPRAPTLDQLCHVLACMPTTNEIERRDRALVAFTMLTGARDGAIASLKIKHLSEDKVAFDAREVHTKFSKTFTTWFFPVGGDVRQIVVEWVEYLLREKLFGLDDPLFPATEVALNADQQFEAAGLSRRHWSNATPIRNIFREAFARAGLPYFNPHSVRNTLVLLGEKLCRTPEQFKAWSQNLGHEKVLTTFSAYGAVPVARQSEIIRELGQRPDTDNRQLEDLAQQLMRVARRTPA
jgi:site-specific recombinase XerC